MEDSPRAASGEIVIGMSDGFGSIFGLVPGIAAFAVILIGLLIR